MSPAIGETRQQRVTKVEVELSDLRRESILLTERQSRRQQTCQWEKRATDLVRVATNGGDSLNAEVESVNVISSRFNKWNNEGSKTAVNVETDALTKKKKESSASIIQGNQTQV